MIYVIFIVSCLLMGNKNRKRDDMGVEGEFILSIVLYILFRISIARESVGGGTSVKPSDGLQYNNLLKLCDNFVVCGESNGFF